MREAMKTLDSGGLGIVLVVDDQRRLLGTITDGDVRRALLAGKSLDVTALEFVEQKHTPV